jgi:hypothetical protein
VHLINLNNKSENNYKKMKINFDRKYSVNFIAPRAESGTHGWVVVLGACLVFVRKVLITRDANN